jgi:hypothetical protein
MHTLYARPRAGRSEASTFFFEKKNQKTFPTLPTRHCERSEAIHRATSPALHPGTPLQTDKVFFASFFFRKKKTLP